MSGLKRDGMALASALVFALMVHSAFTPDSLVAQTVVGTVVQHGLNPKCIVVYEAQNKVFVADASDKIYVYDGATLAPLGSISTGLTNIVDMVVSEKYGKLYASNVDYDRWIVVIDAKSGTVTRTIQTGNFPKLEKDESLGKIYVLSNELYQVDAATDSVTIIPGIDGKLTASLAVNPVTHELFFTPNPYAPPLSVIDAFSLTHTEVPAVQGFGIGVNWFRNKIYTAYTLEGSSFIYNRTTGAVSRTPTDNDAGTLVFNPTSNRMFSSSEVDTRITIIDGETDSSFTMPFDHGSPHVSNATNHVFYDGPSLRILDGTTLAQMALNVSSWNAAVNQSTNRVFVASIDTLRVIQDQAFPWNSPSPTLMRPLDQSIGYSTSPTFRWAVVPGASSYRLQISPDYSFGPSSIDRSGLQGTTCTMPNLIADTKYYWRITATNGGVTSDFSKVWSFFTDLKIPQPLAPQNRTWQASTSPVLQWGRVPGAVSYGLQVATNSGFSSPLINQVGIADTAFPLSGLPGDSTFYWRVRTNGVNDTTSYSTPCSFTTVAVLPAAPTLISPFNHAPGVTISPVLSWNASGGATSYRLQMALDSSFMMFFVDLSSLYGTTLTASGLGYKTVYYWRVSASNSAGSSMFSSVWSFLTRNLPGDVSGDGAVTAFDASLVLKHVTGVASLEGNALQAGDVSGDGSTSAYDAALILQFAAGIISSFPVH